MMNAAISPTLTSNPILFQIISIVLMGCSVEEMVQNKVTTLAQNLKITDLLICKKFNDWMKILGDNTSQ